jgi:hypothetical protein
MQTGHLRNNSYKKCCEEHSIVIKSPEDYSGEERICLICGQKFVTKYRGWNRKFCYDCSPSYSKEEGKSKTISALRKAIKKYLVKYKGGKCEKCGYNKCIEALQFHHKNPLEKDFAISAQLKLSDFDMDKYKEEVDKCILVCANCHAEIHAEENK